MDVFERLNRRFGSWYEGLFGSGESRDLRPRDVLRRILVAMEDARREGLDGNIYVPNVYTVRIAVSTDEERDYLRTFLSAEELAAAVFQTIEQHGYRLRGGLVFTVEEMTGTKLASEPGADRLQIQCRFDPTAGVSALAANDSKASSEAIPAPARVSTQAAMPSPAEPAAEPSPRKKKSAEEQPGTLPAGPMATLAISDSRGRNEVISVTRDGLRIGRGLQIGNDLVLEDSMVSKRHARIVVENGDFVLRDENSTNGTYINEIRAPAQVSVPLRTGDTIRLGMTSMRYSRLADVGRGAEPPTVPAPREAHFAASTPDEDWQREETRFDFGPLNRSGAAAKEQTFRLIGESGEVFPLASQMTVGRALTGDITLIGDGVASQHARLNIKEGALYVEDLGTESGTYVNGEAIPPKFPVALYHGDRVRFGEVSLMVDKFRVGEGN
ncbi:MAG: hypothetical protein OHK0029_09650 [Armatimonadaceae bacterium]